MQLLLISALSFSVPIITWILMRKKYDARWFPLIVGVFSYAILISLPRSAARFIILNDGVKHIPFLYYLLEALLSGIFEEVGRYMVFRYLIPKYDEWRDCCAYGLGHCVAEAVLISHFIDNTLSDSIIESISDLTGIAFSIAMSVMVFTAVHFRSDRKLLYLAVGFHTLIDFVSGLYFMKYIGLIELEVFHLMIIAGACYTAYRVYRKTVYDV